MTDETFGKLEEELYRKPKLSFGKLLPWTGAGALGGIVASSFQNYLRTPFREGVLRFVSGSTDSIFEGIYTAATELPKYFKRTENKGGPVVYYVCGKLFGAGLSWLPDYFLRNLGVDVHSAFPGSLAATSYAQLDQIGGYLGLLIYHMRNSGSIVNGFTESLKYPVSQASLIATCVGIGTDSIARTQLTPNNFWYDWLETWALSFLCLLPVWRGRTVERKMRKL